MKPVIVKPVNELRTYVFNQSDQANWRDGKKEWYKLPRDYRPSAIDNVQELGDDGQTYQKLYNLAHERAGLDGTAEDLKKQLAEIKELYELADAYTNHVLAQLLDGYGETDEPASQV